MPGYSSIDAGCSIQIDLLRPTPERAAEEIKKAYAIAVQAVEQHLAEQLAAQPAARPAAAAEPGPAAAEPAKGKRHPKDWGGSSEPPGPKAAPRAGTAPANGRHDLPANGRQLYAWLKKREQAENRDIIPGLVRWAKDGQIRGRILDWNGQETARALAYLDDARDPRRN